MAVLPASAAAIRPAAPPSAFAQRRIAVVTRSQLVGRPTITAAALLRTTATTTTTTTTLRFLLCRSHCRSFPNLSPTIPSERSPLRLRSTLTLESSLTLRRSVSTKSRSTDHVPTSSNKVPSTRYASLSAHPNVTALPSAAARLDGHPAPPSPPGQWSPSLARPYQDVGTLSLINSYAVLQLCGFRPLVDWAETILSAAERLHLSWLVHWVVKQTFFKHFCGGEDLKEVVPTMRRLESRNIGSILDLAMEADIDSQEGQSLTPKAVQDQSAKVADLMLDAIQIASKSRGAFIALKVTAFFPPVLLLEWSNALYRVRDAFNVAATGSLGPLAEPTLLPTLRPSAKSFKDALASQFVALQKNSAALDTLVSQAIAQTEISGPAEEAVIDWFAVTRTVSWSNLDACRLLMVPQHSTANNNATESQADPVSLITPALGELNRVIAAAAHAGVRVMVDAEQTYFQPAIDDVTKILSATHNIGSPRAMPVVFGTYQLYLRDALSRLQTDADGFRRARIPFGVKIVRGAYMESERERAAEMGYPDPVQPSIAATHAAYDSAIDGLVERVRAATKGDVNTPAVQFVIASHNVGSVGRGIKALSDAGLGKSGKSDDESAVAPVAFAQLMGMQDGTTFSIAASGYKAFKYVPYGPIKVTIPYLLRRAQENSAVLGGVADDKRNLAKELRLRFVPWAKA